MPLLLAVAGVKLFSHGGGHPTRVGRGVALAPRPVVALVLGGAAQRPALRGSLLGDIVFPFKIDAGHRFAALGSLPSGVALGCACFGRNGGGLLHLGLLHLLLLQPLLSSQLV
jgi:hypothetical protein